MYTNSGNTITGRLNIANYIEGSDIYNSKLIAYISENDFDRVRYVIRTYEYRPDLISADFYGSTEYYGLFLLTCGVSIDDMKYGKILYLLPKSTLDFIIKMI